MPSSPVEALAFVAAALQTPVKKRKERFIPGDTTYKLKTSYREHRVEILAGPTLLVMYVEARFGKFQLCELSCGPKGSIDFPDSGRVVQAAGREYKFYCHPRKPSPAQVALLESGALERILDAVDLKPGEELLPSEDLVQVFLHTATKRRIMALLHAIIRHMPHEQRGVLEEHANLPESLRPLVPLLERWAVSDDEERAQKLRRCAVSTRARLAERVTPLLPVIDEYLSSFGKDPPEEALPWMDLAQAAIEAQMSRDET